MTNKDFEYFTKTNKENIYIDELHLDFRVWKDHSIVCEFLTLNKAIKLANKLYKQNKD